MTDSPHEVADLRKQLEALQAAFAALHPTAPDPAPTAELKPKRKRKYRNGTIRKLPSGFFQLRLKIPGSLPPVYYGHPSGTFRTETEAARALDIHNAEIAAGTWRHPDDIAREQAQQAKQKDAQLLTVNEAADLWLAAAERGEHGPMNKGTISTYRSRVNQFRDPWGEVRVSDVLTEDVLVWFRSLAVRSRPRAVQLVDIFDRVLRYIAEATPDVIRRSPVEIPADERRYETEGAGLLIPDDVILAISRHMPAEYGSSVVASGWLALREGEVLGLAVDAFLSDDLVHVFRNSQTKGGARIDAPKSRAGDRHLPIPEPAREALIATRKLRTHWLYPAVTNPRAARTRIHVQPVVGCCGSGREN